jgi:ribonuclease HII
VILNPASPIAGLKDSKKLSARRREALSPQIQALSLAWGLGWASAREVDTHNILVATFWAMQRAVCDCLARLASVAGLEGAHVTEAFAIHVDGQALPGRTLGSEVWPWATQAVVGGDALVAEISAASILAKVARDAEMARLDSVYPGYGFAQHAGYGTAAHQRALADLGPCPEHRRSFAPIARLIGQTT